MTRRGWIVFVSDRLGNREREDIHPHRCDGRGRKRTRRPVGVSVNDLKSWAFCGCIKAEECGMIEEIPEKGMRNTESRWG